MLSLSVKILAVIALALGLAATTIHAQDPFDADRSDCPQAILLHRFTELLITDLPDGIYHLTFWLDDPEIDAGGTLLYALSTDGWVEAMDNPSWGASQSFPEYGRWWRTFHHEGPVYLARAQDNVLFDLPRIKWVFELRQLQHCSGPSDAVSLGQQR